MELRQLEMFLAVAMAGVLAFVDLLVAGTAVTDEEVAAVRSELGDANLVTLIALVGHYWTVARLTVVLDIELDAAPDGWTREH